MSRAGEYSFMYLGELIGIGLMFCGFQLAGAKRPSPAQPHAPAAKAKASIGALAAK
jgi:hypothetical protein